MDFGAGRTFPAIVINFIGPRWHADNFHIVRGPIAGGAGFSEDCVEVIVEKPALSVASCRCC